MRSQVLGGILLKEMSHDKVPDREIFGRPRPKKTFRLVLFMYEILCNIPMRIRRTIPISLKGNHGGAWEHLFIILEFSILGGF